MTTPSLSRRLAGRKGGLPALILWRWRATISAKTTALGKGFHEGNRFEGGRAGADVRETGVLQHGAKFVDAGLPLGVAPEKTAEHGMHAEAEGSQRLRIRSKSKNR